MTAPVSPLLTDLYQLTMLQSYWQEGLNDEAVFEFFVRQLPPQRNFLVAAGLEQALDFLESLAFSPAEIDWLRTTGRFDGTFLDRLAELRFSGAVHAMAEGTLCFADEPLLQVRAPLLEAQLVESRLINLLHYQTLVASKAARCVLTAPEQLLVDFGMRRAHGAEAALAAARASYLAGFAGSATVLAGKAYGIPVFGTMAHSYILAHVDETEAFQRFARAHPDNVVLLIDTYDTEAGARKVVELAPWFAEQGITIRGVRLDSGDLAAHAFKVRDMLDAAGLTATQVFSSGNLDEYALEDLLTAGAPIGGFGIGTRLVTSHDVPYLDCAYKLQQYAGRPLRKRSEGKETWPGAKQVFRRHDADGLLAGDLIAVDGEEQPGEPLLREVMRDGRRLKPQEELDRIRERCRSQLLQLPPAARGLTTASACRVEFSDALRELAAEADRNHP